MKSESLKQGRKGTTATYGELHDTKGRVSAIWPILFEVAFAQLLLRNSSFTEMDLFKAMHREVPQEDWFRLRDNFLRERGDLTSVSRKSMLLFRSE